MRSFLSLPFLRPPKAILVPGMYFLGFSRYSNWNLESALYASRIGLFCIIPMYPLSTRLPCVCSRLCMRSPPPDLSCARISRGGWAQSCYPPLPPDYDIERILSRAGQLIRILGGENSSLYLKEVGAFLGITFKWKTSVL